MTTQAQIEVRTGAERDWVGHRRWKNARLWTAQGLLSALFLFAGGMKLIVPLDVMLKQMPVALPGAFIRFIGICEVLGALGLILPGVLRMRRELTPLAALGLVVIMVGATAVTVASGGGVASLTPLVVGVLLVSVGRGRREYLCGLTWMPTHRAKTSIEWR